VTVVDRSLKETEPGLFTGRLRLPVAAHYDVALSVDQPRLVHCFGMDAKANPALEALRQTVAVEWMPQQRIYSPKETVKVRFRVLDGAGTPKTGLKDVMVRYFLVPASAPRNVNAKEVESGIYEAAVELGEAGAYYVYVGVNSLKLGYNDSGFLSLMARPGGAPPAAAPKKPAETEKAN
jgi:hypothetical protein